MATWQTDHTVTGAPLPAPPEPINPPEPFALRSAAEEARTLVAQATIGSLATLSEDGTPWASVVTYGALPDGSPVFYVSTLAEHGRNLERDGRASIVVSEDGGAEDPLDRGRVTLAGTAHKPEGEELEAARAAHFASLPGAAFYERFGDFSFWVLTVDRVRWVGGYGRMDSSTAADYAAAEPDPVASIAIRATAHLNDDHDDALLDMARVLGGFPDATSAVCTRSDRYGLDLAVRTPRGRATTRVGFAEPCTQAGDLRSATVALARRARA